jgi:tRNA(Ile)-lysidine synthase
MSWTPTHAHVHQLLKDHPLLPQGTAVLIAVSGGQDSVCLGQLLCDLQPHWGWRLGVAHCDHGWRSDAGENARFVAGLAAQWQVPFHLQQAPADLAKTEATARDWRYGALGAVAIAHHYTHLVTGHTASDRSETLLYNLLRGSGVTGLKGMVWSRPLAGGSAPEAIQLVRPLLNLTRADTLAFCQTQDLTWWEDSTNADLHYARNRIRQELLPYVRSHFNPNADRTLAQAAQILAAEDDYLEQQVDQLYPQMVDQGLRLNRPGLRSQPLAIQRRICRRLLQHKLSQPLPSKSLRSPRFDQIEKLVALLNAPNRSQSDPFPGGAIARVEGDWVDWTQPPSKATPPQKT